MPRPKKEGAAEPKRRSRHGCWPCKTRKIKCGEEKPSCLNCERQGETCDYSIRLNWEGRGRKKEGEGSPWSNEHLTLEFGSPRSYTSQSHSPQPQPPSSSVSSHPASFRSPQGLSGGIQYTSQPQPQSQTPSPFSQPHQPLTNLDPRLSSGMKRKRDNVDMELPPESNLDYFSPYGRTLPQPVPNQVWRSPHTNYATLPGGPLTPASDESQSKSTGMTPSGSQQQQQYQQAQQAPRDLRRLSVQYLLQSPVGTEESLDISAVDDKQGVSAYGYDQGLPDLDLPENDDANALIPQSPATATKRLSIAGLSNDGDGMRQGVEFGFGLHTKDTHFEREEYYAQPIQVKIPRYLEPLPQMLLANPMNLLYFHHFLNHTAKILVAHDCPENPFRNVLPQMALRNENLLNLLLAYAASHRARLLMHPDPTNRIALFVRDVFPNLRHALENHGENVSDASLATAIMLASLEIISPNAFEVPVSWQNHLTIARKMIVARGGIQSLRRKGKGAYFLGQWFAYLDVMGSLSGSYYDRPLRYSYLDEDDSSSGGAGTSDADEFSPSDIDCLLGFTNGCISILARVADLAWQCDSHRAEDPMWTPPPSIIDAAEKLKGCLQAARPTVFRVCLHGQPSAADPVDSFEMIALNDTYHWAGLIHLYRRVLGKRPQDEEVQFCVREIVASVDRVRIGATAEACMIFPMFTAGCEAQDEGQRRKLLDRLRNVESYGMTQVKKARTLMERVWETGKPWEALVAGEFVG